MTVVALILVFVQFFVSINNDIEKSTYENLQLTAEQHVVALEAKLDGQFNLLDSLSSHIANFYDGEKFSGTKPLLADFAKTSGFTFIGVADGDGTADISTGETIDISGRDYFINSLSGKRAIQKLAKNKIHDIESIIISVPVLTEEGEVAGVLFGSVYAKDFEKPLVSQAYYENTYSFITDTGGNIIIKSSSPNFVHENNIFILTDQENNGTDAYKQFCKNLSAKESGVCELVVNGSENYIFYTAMEKSYDAIPSGAEDWVLFTSVPKSAVREKSVWFSRTMVILAIELTVISGGVIALIIYSFYQKSKIIERENEEIRQNVEMYRIINDFSDNIIFNYDRESNQITFNNVYEKIFKRKPFVETSQNLTKVNPFINRYDQSAYAKFVADNIAGLPKTTAQFRLLRPDGLYDWYKASTVTLYGLDNNPVKTVGKLVNVQEHHTTIEKLTLRAESDSLTKIYNHTSMKEKVNRSLTAGGKRRLSALMYIDLDNFKAVNDTMGHIAGDQLLVRIAQNIQQLFRETDIVGRMGGDEFAVYVKDLRDMSMIGQKATSLIKSINAMKLTGSDLFLSCSMGVAVYGKDGSTFDELYKSADKALYKAKKIKNTYLLYSPEDSEMVKGAHEHRLPPVESAFNAEQIEEWDDLDDPSQA